MPNMPKLKPSQSNALIAFIEGPLHQKLSRHQRRILQAVARSRHVAIAGAHGTGKSFVLACLAIAWAAIYPDSRVLIVTPGWLMNKAVVWTEIYSILERAKHRLPIVSQTMTEIRLGQKNFIMAISSKGCCRPAAGPPQRARVP